MAPGLQKPDEAPAADGGFEAKPGAHEGILDPVVAARRSDLRRYVPSAALDPYVSTVLPHPSVNVAFTAERGWITGVTTGTYAYEVAAEGLIVGTMFRPGGFHAFRPLPVADLTGRVIPATDVFPAAGDPFRGALVARADDTALVAGMEAMLLRASPHGGRALDLVTEAFAVIGGIATPDPSMRTVAALAERLGLSERRLQALFREHVGVRPKWVLMRQRHIAAAEAAARVPDPDWAAIALDLGYADQPHFVNDFRRLVGVPPDAYARQVRGATGGGDPGPGSS